MKRKLLIFSVLAICVAILAAGTIAFFNAEGKAHNVITTGGVGIAVQEWADEARETPFEDLDGILPGMKVTKLAEIKNTGTAEAWIRVLVTKGIELAGDGEPDLSLLQLDLNTTDWTLGEDGYLYYNKPLPAGGDDRADLHNGRFQQLHGQRLPERHRDRRRRGPRRPNGKQRQDGTGGVRMAGIQLKEGGDSDAQSETAGRKLAPRYAAGPWPAALPGDAFFLCPVRRHCLAGQCGGGYRYGYRKLCLRKQQCDGRAAVYCADRKGSAFRKTLEIPKLFNYSIPTDQAEGLEEGIALQKDNATGNYTLQFDLDAVQENVTVTLYYVAGTAKYTVYHYYQNLEDNQYALDPTIVELEGDIDAYTRAVANHKPGYRCKGIPQTTIAADGSTKVEIYYDREYYTVTFDVNGGIDGPEPIYAKYGTTFDASKVKEPRRKGYRFLGWSPELTGTVTIEQSMTYVAQWEAEKGHADYTIVLWGQNANDDEYSYLSSHQAWGYVGHEVTWDPEIEISHVHTDKCWELTCGKKEHTHTAECLQNCPHTHDLTCYGLNANASSVNPNGEVEWWNKSKPETYFEQLGLEDGYLYHDDENAALDSADFYYLRLNGKYYSLTAALFNQLKGDQVGQTSDGTSGNPDYYYKYSINQSGISCTHTHDATCYSCGMEAHDHSDACGTLICGLSETPKKYMSDIQPDSKLWTYERSDTVTVAADGSSVLNVYFTRKVFTLQFRNAYSNSNDYGTINARWGENIADEYNAIVKKAGSSFWSENRNASGPYTNYIGVMPQRNITYYRYMPDGYGTSTMTYYAEDLNGTYQVIFTLTFKGTNFTVTDEDRYEFEGLHL